MKTSRPTPKNAPRKRARTRARRFLPRLTGWRRWTVFTIVGGILAFILLFGFAYVFAHVPEPNDLATAQSVVVLDDHGHQIGRIHAEADRVSIPLRDMPVDLQHAVIATEDRTFYSNPGISIGGIVRAAISNVFGHEHQGGSTITQQYVKNAFVGNRRSLFRKFREAVIALKLDHERSKKEILTLYLNTIYFGRGAYGCEAASQAYFGKHAKQLTLPEAALLAGLIRSPEHYDPAHDPAGALERRNVVLSLMVRDRYITQKQLDQAKATKISARAPSLGGIAPHYLEDVRQFLEDKIGARQLYTGGVTVRVTLDAKMQGAAIEAVREVYDRKDDPEAALVALDPHTGAVRAMVGARDYAKRQLNLATSAHRQPGSTFKPATLATYVDEGQSIKDKYKAPARITVHTDSGPYPVTNFDERGRGTLTVEQATWLSVNTVYVQVVQKAQPANVVVMAHKLGIVSPLNAVTSIALGTSDVTPLELTDMFATFAARGEHHEPYLVEQVTDRRGKVLYQHAESGNPAIDPNVADTVNFVLQGVLKEGTGRPEQLSRPAAGKTGTTEDFRDAWFAGYTPELAAVVWNGYPQAGKKLRSVHGINVVGSSFPGQMWKLFMQKALADLPVTSFAKPKLVEPSPTASPSVSPSPSPSPSPTLPPSGPSPSVPPPSPSKPPNPHKSPSPSPSASPITSSSP